MGRGDGEVDCAVGSSCSLWVVAVDRVCSIFVAPFRGSAGVVLEGSVFGVSVRVGFVI